MLEVWGGRMLDKYFIENCGFFEYLIFGDMVMVDWGFIIIESVGLKYVKLVILVFIKGKD